MPALGVLIRRLYHIEHSCGMPWIVGMYGGNRRQMLRTASKIDRAKSSRIQRAIR